MRIPVPKPITVILSGLLRVGRVTNPKIRADIVNKLVIAIEP